MPTTISLPVLPSAPYISCVEVPYEWPSMAAMGIPYISIYGMPWILGVLLMCVCMCVCIFRRLPNKPKNWGILWLSAQLSWSRLWRQAIPDAVPIILCCSTYEGPLWPEYNHHRTQVGEQVKRKPHTIFKANTIHVQWDQIQANTYVLHW